MGRRSKRGDIFRCVPKKMVFAKWATSGRKVGDHWSPSFAKWAPSFESGRPVVAQLRKLVAQIAKSKIFGIR